MYISFGGIVYFFIGLLVAINTGYTVHGLDNTLDFLLVMVAWPVVLLFDIHPQIHISSLGMIRGATRAAIGTK